MACPQQKVEPLRDPRYIALQTELMGMNERLDALLNISLPKPFSIDIFTIDKAAAFTDTEVNCQGADVVMISTDGDLKDISYKILLEDGRLTSAIQAAESPKIPGSVTAVFVTNAEAEAGKNVRVSRMTGAIDILTVIQQGTPAAVSVSTSKRMFYAAIVDYVGTLNYFETDQAMGTTPTLSFVGAPAAENIMIHEIRHQLTPTNAVTYQLYLLEAATADDQQQEAEIIFDSGSGQVSGAIYKQVAGGSPAKLPTLAKLTTAGTIYYMVDWSAAPGDTTGYIKVYGEVLG